MKCLDNIYTKQIKYNAPVLYQLESLKKEYEKLLKVSNEIINTGSFIEECYFENQSAVLSGNEITFSGNLKFKTDSGNYFQNIPSSLKLNVQGTGEIIVDVGEDNKTLTFKLDEEFLSEISLMIEKVNSQVFDNFIGIRNTSDSKIDQIKHMNNNFQITSNDGESLLNIDEQLKTMSSFGKRIAYVDDIYPINSIYISLSPTSPASLFGGTWEQILGKFLLSSDDVLTDGTITTAGSYHIGDNGGSADAVVVSHNHAFMSAGKGGSFTDNYKQVWSATGGSDGSGSPANLSLPTFQGTQGVQNSGVDGTGKNMPPYLVVNMWKRIS